MTGKSNVDFTSEAPEFIIQGYITYTDKPDGSWPTKVLSYSNDQNGFPLRDVTVTFSNGGGKVTTDSNGRYQNKVIYGWSGTVTPSKENYEFNPPPRNYRNVTQDYWDGDDDSPGNQDYLARKRPYLSGFVRDDLNSGIDSVTMTFSDGGGTTKTDPNGRYDQYVPTGWSGTVTPSKSGFTFEPKYRRYTNLIVPGVDQNFLAHPIQSGTTNKTISGKVSDSAGTGMPGVTTTFSNGAGTTTTKSDGTYTHSVPHGYSGTASLPRV